MTDHLTPSQAAERLATATETTRRTQVFNVAWACYCFFTAAASTMILGQWATDNYGLPQTPWLILGLAWNTIGVLLVVVVGLSSQFARRGFGRNWMIALVLWGATFIPGLMFSVSPYVAILFPVYAAVGILLELRAVDRT